jgi:hypothetical protein
VRLAGYTGPQGSTQRRLTTAIDPHTGNLEFATTAPLDSYAGLTIVAAFPTGSFRRLRRRSGAQRCSAPTRCSSSDRSASSSTCCTISPPGSSWDAIHRAARSVPQFEPPLGLEAASVR